jgi:hypothetical protein
VATLNRGYFFKLAVFFFPAALDSGRLEK